MSNKPSIYSCPHCGEKSFNPLTKAMAGGLNSRGKACPSCGKRCVNGQVSTIVSAIIYVLALIGVVYFYLVEDHDLIAYAEMLGCIVVALLLTKLFDAFFMPLVSVIRNDVRR